VNKWNSIESGSVYNQGVKDRQTTNKSCEKDDYQPSCSLLQDSPDLNAYKERFKVLKQES